MLRPLTGTEVRSIDQRALDEFHMPGILLMENAGRGVADLLKTVARQGKIVIVAGKGNNGGDGWVIARHLECAGYRPHILLLAKPDSLSADAAVNYRIVQQMGLPIDVAYEGDWLRRWQQILSQADWIVDALLGTGSEGELKEPYTPVVQLMNSSSGKILAVDVPTGLNCDTGKAVGECVQAEMTATFVAEKVGFQNKSAQRYLGQIIVIDIGVPRSLLHQYYTNNTN